MAIQVACVALLGSGWKSDSPPSFLVFHYREAYEWFIDPRALRFRFQSHSTSRRTRSQLFSAVDTLVVHSKGQQDMASEADLNTELLIRGRINARFPQDAFLGEETGRTEFS